MRFVSDKRKETILWISIFSLVVALGIDVKLARDDAKLIGNLQMAVQRTKTLAALEESIALQPTLSTREAWARGALKRTYIAVYSDLAESQSEQVQLDEMKDVVYWVRPTWTRDARVVGVYWDNSGERRVFFGIVYAPFGARSSGRK